jgi:hypothetical protein
MTLLTAIIFGIGTGLLMADRRRRLWVTGIAVTVMLPIQSWGLPLVTKPNFSLSDPEYWGVQPFILLIGLLLALGVGRLRHRAVRPKASRAADVATTSSAVRPVPVDRRAS